MTRIKRGGRELVVPDTSVAAYLKEGYAVIDDQGNVLTKAQAMTFSQLKAEHDTLNKQLQGAIAQAEQYKQELDRMKTCRDERIEELEGQVAALNAELEQARSELQGATKAEHHAIQAGNTQASSKASSATKSSTGGKPAQKG